MNQVFEHLSTCRKSSLAFHEAYQIVYTGLMETGAESFSEMIRKEMNDHFHRNIDQHLQHTEHVIRVMGDIYHDFLFYRHESCALFRMIERFLENFDLKQSMTVLFVGIFRIYVKYDDVLGVFFEQFDRLQRLEKYSKNDPDFESVINCSKLIQLTYPENINDFLEKACSHVKEYSLEFVRVHAQLSPRDFVDSAVSTLEFEKWMSKLLFEHSWARDAICQTCYDVITSEKDTTFNNCIEMISNSCKERDAEFPKILYQLVEFRAPEREILSRIASAIKSQLIQETIDIPAFADTIVWYTGMVESSMKNDSHILRLFRNDLISHVNGDKVKLFRDVLLYIQSQAKSGGDISQITPVLLNISNKTEFEIQYTRWAARRLVPVSSKQIEMEQEMLKQVKDSSGHYEFKQLTELLREALQSLELHIGRVVVVSASLWPFRSPYPIPIALSKFTDEIALKYHEMYASRVLKFPIENWQWSLRDTKTGVLIMANGVQAEILLYLNDHASIKEDALEPNIPTALVAASLKTLDRKRFPLLVKTEGNQYIINSEFKRTVAQFTLPRPILSENAAILSQLNQMRDDALDSEVMRIMKSARALPIRDLESRVRQNLSNMFSISFDELRARVTSLAGRNYIEIKDDGQVLYTP